MIMDVPGLLCTTMWITCAKRCNACVRLGEMLGIMLRGVTHNTAFTWEIVVPALCIKQRSKLSTRHAVIIKK
jgi:hypothetical protein